MRLFSTGLLFWVSIASATPPVAPPCHCLDPSTLKRILDYNSGPHKPKKQSLSWMARHLGDQPDQISRVVFKRARKLYLEKKAKGLSKNACYVAMDATRPHELKDGKVNNRAYLICEDLKIFLPYTSAHGSGVNVPGFELMNSRKCVANFGNMLNSHLTTGGTYMTGAINNAYKGEIESPDGTSAPYYRKFLEFIGEGATENSQARDIGAHAATLLNDGCYRYEPTHPRAKDGFVYYVKQPTDYSAGRTNGCMGMTEATANTVISVAENNPMTVFVYPEARDIKSINEHLTRNEPLGDTYWNAECLTDIQSPKFWDRATDEPGFLKATALDKALKAAKAAAKIRTPNAKKPTRILCLDSALPPTPVNGAAASAH